MINKVKILIEINIEKTLFLVIPEKINLKPESIKRTPAMSIIIFTELCVTIPAKGIPIEIKKVRTIQRNVIIFKDLTFIISVRTGNPPFL